MCVAFTYTYNLKGSFGSWISPCPLHLKISVGPFRISDALWWASFGLRRLRTLSCESWKSLSHSFGTLCLLFSCSYLKKLAGLRVAYISVIYFIGRDYILDMVFVVAQQVHISSYQMKQLLQPPPTHQQQVSPRQQRGFAGSDPILWISVTFQSNFLTYHHHPIVRTDTSVWDKAPQET